MQMRHHLEGTIRLEGVHHTKSGEPYVNLDDLFMTPVFATEAARLAGGLAEALYRPQGVAGAAPGAEALVAMAGAEYGLPGILVGILEEGPIWRRARALKTQAARVVVLEPVVKAFPSDGGSARAVVEALRHAGYEVEAVIAIVSGRADNPFGCPFHHLFREDEFIAASEPTPDGSDSPEDPSSEGG